MTSHVLRNFALGLLATLLVAGCSTPGQTSYSDVYDAVQMVRPTACCANLTDLLYDSSVLPALNACSGRVVLNMEYIARYLADCEVDSSHSP